MYKLVLKDNYNGTTNVPKVHKESESMSTESHSANAFVQNTSHFAQLQEGNLTGTNWK